MATKRKRWFSKGMSGSSAMMLPGVGEAMRACAWLVALLPWLASAKTFRSLPAIMKAGGRFLAKGNPAQVYDAGLSRRTVLLEFDGVAQAIAAHDSAEYQAALRVLGTAVDRDLRIVEGVE